MCACHSATAWARLRVRQDYQQPHTGCSCRALRDVEDATVLLADIAIVFIPHANALTPSYIVAA